MVITFACAEATINSDKVTVSTNHNPLETIALKVLLSAPQNIQRLSLRLQKYPFEIKYKDEQQEICSSDTLSKAYLPDVMRPPVYMNQMATNVASNH